MRRAIPSRALAAALVVLALPGCAWWREVPAPAVRAGDVLVDRNDRHALYTFDRDVAYAGESRCVAECLGRWRPLVAPAGARNRGDWWVIARPDGSRQWSYAGKPLYRFAGDMRPADRDGHGVDNLWRLARP